MFRFNGFDIIGLLQNFIVLFTAITFHEYAHGWVAHKLGDPTAKSMGRLTLNPLAHLDPIGALMMVFFRFGWAKPVPVNPYYFKEPKKDMALVAVAGPIANIITAFVSITICPVFLVVVTKLGAINNVTLFIAQLFAACAQLNIYFAIFNLIPFPPLDGSKILFSVLPNQVYNKLLTYERYGMIVLIFLSVTGVLGDIIYYAARPVTSLMDMWFAFLTNILQRGIL